MMDFIGIVFASSRKNCLEFKESRNPVTIGLWCAATSFHHHHLHLHPSTSIHPLLNACWLLFGDTFYEEFSLLYNSTYDSIYKER